jgi:hypothetical protein
MASPWEWRPLSFWSPETEMRQPIGQHTRIRDEGAFDRRPVVQIFQAEDGPNERGNENRK